MLHASASLKTTGTRRRICLVIFITVTVLAIMLLDISHGAAKEIGPETNWCAAIQSLAPGEDLVLRPGEYEGPCSIRRGGTVAAPLIIRAKDTHDPPRIVYRERNANVLSLRADHVAIRGLQFRPTLPGTDAIRIYTANDVTVEDCRFIQVGGIAVVANHSSVRKIVVRRNVIVQSRSTAMYFGCHDGSSCTVSDLLIEQNYIHGVTASESEVGYGVEVKLNSVATIRDNVIVDTKGPGIMVFGSADPEKMSLIERNFVAESRNSSGIVIGGGPTVVRNNITTRSNEAGISLENYGDRGLLRGIVVAHNTVYGNEKGGILAPREGKLAAIIANNAVQARPGTSALPPEHVGLRSSGNVDCTRLPCFVDPDQRDFSPVGLRPGNSTGESWMPLDDYLGRRRSAAPIPGAIEHLAGPIPLSIKSMRPEGQQ